VRCLQSPDDSGTIGQVRRRDRIEALLADEAGLTTVEYIIVLCLIAVVGFAIWKQFGQTVEYKAKGATNVVSDLPTESSE